MWYDSFHKMPYIYIIQVRVDFSFVQWVLLRPQNAVQEDNAPPDILYMLV